MECFSLKKFFLLVLDDFFKKLKYRIFSEDTFVRIYATSTHKKGYIGKYILIIIFDHSIGLVKKDIRTFKGIMIQTMEK